MTFKSWMIPLISVVILALNFAWLVMRDNNFMWSPFAFPDKDGKEILVSITEYIDYAIRSFPYLIILGMLIKFVPKFRNEFMICGAMWIGWLIDFFFTFNEPIRFANLPLFDINVPCSYSFLMALGLVCWFGYDYLTDNYGL